MYGLVIILFSVYLFLSFSVFLLHNTHPIHDSFMFRVSKFDVNFGLCLLNFFMRYFSVVLNFVHLFLEPTIVFSYFVMSWILNSRSNYDFVITA